ncbi:hypothetical protein X975_19058, partial [Stegodyphus mimosarum]
MCCCPIFNCAHDDLSEITSITEANVISSVLSISSLKEYETQYKVYHSLH